MTKTELCKCGHEEDLHHYGKWCQKIIGWDEDKQSTIMGIKGERGENIDCPCKKFEAVSEKKGCGKDFIGYKDTWDKEQRDVIVKCGQSYYGIIMLCKDCKTPKKIQSQDVVSSQNRGTAGRSKITPDTQNQNGI